MGELEHQPAPHRRDVRQGPLHRSSSVRGKAASEQRPSISYENDIMFKMAASHYRDGLRVETVRRFKEARKLPESRRPQESGLLGKHRVEPQHLIICNNIPQALL